MGLNKRFVNENENKNTQYNYFLGLNNVNSENILINRLKRFKNINSELKSN